ncbi:MAG: helix-turn-helix domain-containing protein [Puniceicoccales bacterium]|jgi:hypothetical protein|nr:helix-turn-helix domain-containing protein [Puniceicoccales bacterium]
MSKPETFEELQKALVDQAVKAAQDQWKVLEKERKLSSLFRDLGFRSNADLIKALQELGDAKPKKVKGEKKPKVKAKAKAKGKRIRLTDEVRVKVLELKLQGKSAAEISKELGISQPSVYKITKGGSAEEGSPSTAA